MSDQDEPMPHAANNDRGRRRSKSYDSDVNFGRLAIRHGQVGDQLTALVNRPQLEGNIFSGDLAVRIGTPDTDRYAYTVSLSLQLRGYVLNGSASAIADASPRERNAVSHWLELRKEQPK